EAEKRVWGIREEVETDKHLLNILIGNGPDAPLDIAEMLPPLPSQLEIPQTVSIDLLSRRPDLMAQIWRVEALANEVGAAKADFYPNINLTGFLGLESVLYALLFKSSSKTAGLEPAIHLPIFTAGAIRANIRAKKALFDDAVEQYNALILQSTQEVSDLLIFAEALFHQKQEQEGIVASAETRYDVTRLRNQMGLDSLLETYALQEEVIAKELDNVTLLFGQYAAAIKLIKSLGGGYQSEYSIPITAKELP
ncbi:MAG: TolC family protein, partial [Chlamydiota bacterium]